MVFVVLPKTWFLTNRNIRNALGLDYKYECYAIFTTYTGDNSRIVRTISYRATDPMGAANRSEGATLDLDSKKEKIENR